MLNRNDYSKRTLSIFQIIAAYFTDIFYNDLYLKARDNHNINGNDQTTLTDEYRKIILRYEYGLCKSDNKNYYQSVIKELLEYYRVHTKYKTILMHEFVDSILKEFLPNEHFEILTSNEKYFFLNKIIVSIVRHFIEKIVTDNMLKIVIDNHWDDDNPEIFKEQLIDIQIIEREKLFSKFVKEELKKNGHNNTVDADFLDKMKKDRDILCKKIEELIKEKCEIQAKWEQSKKIVEELYKERNALTKKCKQYSDKLKALEIESSDKIKELESQLNNQTDSHYEDEIRDLYNENNQLKDKIRQLEKQIEKRSSDVFAAGASDEPEDKPTSRRKKAKNKEISESDNNSKNEEAKDITENSERENIPDEDKTDNASPKSQNEDDDIELLKQKFFSDLDLIDFTETEDGATGEL